MYQISESFRNPNSNITAMMTIYKERILYSVPISLTATCYLVQNMGQIAQVVLYIIPLISTTTMQN